MPNPLDEFLPQASKTTEEKPSVASPTYANPIDEFLPSKSKEEQPEPEGPGVVHIPSVEKYIPSGLTNFQEGLVRGARDVFNTSGKGMYYLGKILPGGEKRYQDFLENINTEKEKYEKEYGKSTAANLGRVAGQTLISAPIIEATLPTTGIAAAVGALPTVAATGAKIAAPLSRRLGAAAITGALGGAEFGGLTQTATDKSLPESVGEGALTGAVGGPVLAGAGALAKGIGRGLVGKVSPYTAELADRAKQLGIDITAPQMGGNFPKKVEQMTGMLPFSGKDALNARQTAQFNKAVSRTFGEDADNLSTEMVNNALYNKIGPEIGNIAKRNTIKADQALHNDLLTILDDADKNVTEAELKPIFKQIMNVANKVDASGNISGETYNSLTKYNGVLSQAQKNKNPNISSYANRIRNALDDALTRHISPEDKQALLDARLKYKSAKTIQDLVERDPEGNVSPLRLMSKVMKSPGKKSKAGELGELADIGREFFPTPPESGTPLGSAILEATGTVLRNPITGFVGLGGHALGLGTLSAVKTGGLLAANRIVRTGLNSKALANTLVKIGKGSTSGKLDELTTYATPYVASQTGTPIVEKAKKLKLPVALR